MGIEHPINILVWIGIGALMGVLYVLSQLRSINAVTHAGYQRLMPSTFIISSLRIVICSAILFFAFRQSLLSGIAGFLSFITSRWITLIFLLRKEAKRNK